MKNYRKIFGLNKPEFTTPVSDQNLKLNKNREGLNLTQRTVHFDGNFCSCSGCRRFQSLKDMSTHRHAQEVENSKAKRT